MPRLKNLLKINWELLAIIIIFIFLFFQFYYGIFHFQYSTPPGDDPVRHMTQAHDIVQNGYNKTYFSFDPPLFHTLLASMEIITGLNIVTVTKWFAPMLSIFVIISVYFITKRLFKDRTLSILATALYALFSPQYWYIYEDGTYLDIYAGGIMMIYFLSFLPDLLKSGININSIRYLFLTLIFGGGVILSHSLSATQLILILIILFLILLLARIFKFNTNNHALISLAILSILLTITFVPFSWNHYFKTVFTQILYKFNFSSKPGAWLQAIVDFDPSSKVPDFYGYVWLLNLLLIVLSILGLIYGFNYLRNKNLYTKILVIIWPLSLLAASRFTFFILPIRFVRQMAIPVCIFAAIFIYYFTQKIGLITKKIFIVLIIILTTFQVTTILNRSIQYEPLIRIQESDNKAIAWIKQNTDQSDIFLGTPTINNGYWASHIELLTERKVLDTLLCPAENIITNYKCDIIYDPMRPSAIEYYHNHSVDYVYSGKIIFGSYFIKDKIDWDFASTLSKANYLKPVAEFPEPKLGVVRIFKVDQKQLKKDYDRLH